jgi:hypothetical protein
VQLVSDPIPHFPLHSARRTDAGRGVSRRATARNSAGAAVVRIFGQCIVSGGWWASHEVHREYHFAELKRGDCLWVYYDRYRWRWFWQGAVE